MGPLVMHWAHSVMGPIRYLGPLLNGPNVLLKGPSPNGPSINQGPIAIQINCKIVHLITKYSDGPFGNVLVLNGWWMAQCIITKARSIAKILPEWICRIVSWHFLCFRCHLYYAFTSFGSPKTLRFGPNFRYPIIFGPTWLGPTRVGARPNLR